MIKIYAVVVLVLMIAVGWKLYPELAFTQSAVSEAGLNAQMLRTDFDVAEYYGMTMAAPLIASVTPQEARVLGTNDSNKVIEIDLSQQKLYMVENGQKIREFLISSGKWGRTPTGTFSVWYKTVSTRMKGGSKALRTYYDLPRVPFTMFFYNDQIPKSRGYGVHGAYWHNNFGHPMSHGCINMRPDDAKVVFEWAQPTMPEGTRILAATKENPGTTIVIYGKAPSN